MAIALTGSGGLFTILGKIAYLIDSANLFRGAGDLSASAATSIGPGVDDIAGQFTSSERALADSLFAYRDAVRTANGPFLAQLQRIAQQTLIKLADDDAHLPSLDVPTAMAELIRQMQANPDSVKANVPRADTPVLGSGNTGDAVLAAGVIGPDGLLLEYAFPEILTVACSTDSRQGAAAGSEFWSVTSPVAQNDELSWDWPKGSGVNGAVLVAADASLSETAYNLLDNSDFEAFTSNTPNSWTISTGTPGTSVLKGTSGEVFTGSGSLKIVGDGSELTSLKQTFGTDTLKTLSYSTVYAVNCWLKVSAVPAAGMLAIELIDGSGTVVNDDAGNPNAITKALTAATTSFVPLNGFFRTPSVLPSALAIRLRLTTALSSTKDLLLDRLALTPATQVYAGGPYLAVFSGKTASIAGDEITVQIENDFAGKFQTMFERLFGMRNLGLQLPSNASSGETISDSLIG